MLCFEYRNKTWYVPSDKITEIHKNPDSGAVLIYTVRRTQDPFVITRESEVKYMIMNDLEGVGGLNSESIQRLYNDPSVYAEMAKEEAKDRGIVHLINKLINKEDKNAV